MSRCRVYPLMLAVVALAAAGASAEVSGEKFTADALARIDRHEGATGEQWAWRTSWLLGPVEQGVEAYGGDEWLTGAMRCYDAVVSQMQTGPDGYKGWIGPFIYDPDNAWCDVHIGDAILVNPMLAFAEKVLGDPELEAVYGDAARRYVAVARRHVLEKWDSRGTWYEDGPYGGYRSWDTYAKPGDLSDWSERDDVRKTGISLPLNKQMALGITALRLWRITGEAPFRQKAEHIFRLGRSRFQYFDQHYVWNYWEPLGPWDVKPEENSTVHWVQVHPNRNYQLGEVADIVEAYHSGIVFKREDIERILNTNLHVMWNGDLEKPDFDNANAPHSKRRGGKDKAGCLWSSLADFSETVRKLRLQSLEDPSNDRERIALDHFRKVVAERPVGFARRMARGGALPFEFPTHECRNLHMAAAIPSRVAPGGRTLLISKAWMPGKLEISVVSADGKRKLATLHEGEVAGGGDGLEGIFVHEWDGRIPDAELDGSYRIRWSFPGGYREFPVVVGGEK